MSDDFYQWLKNKMKAMMFELLLLFGVMVAYMIIKRKE